MSALKASRFHIVLLIFFIVSAIDCRAANNKLDTQERALKIIEDFAESLCSVPLEGMTKDFELSGSAQADLNEVLKKLVNLGIKGAAQYQSSKWKGVLQKDIAELLKKKIDCKKEVFKDLKDKLLGTDNFKQSVSKAATNLSPELRYELEWPWKLEKDTARKQFDNPEITILNAGPIKAIALTVDVKTYIYDKKLSQIASFVQCSEKPNDYLISLKELAPTEHIKKQLVGFDAEDMIGIYEFTSKYYRETDMKMFNRTHMFFIDNYEILTEKDYSKNKNYQKIIHAMKSFNPLSYPTAISLEGIARNKVLFVTGETGLFMHDDKGWTVTSVPEDPLCEIKQHYLKKNRPLLYIRPLQLKNTGTYLDPKILNTDTIRIEIQYLVENIGNVEAISVSEAGGAPYSGVLKPGDKVVFNKEAILMKQSGNKESIQQLMSDMEKQDYILKHEGVILYSEKSGNKKYLARFVYKIGKNKVELIKHEIK